MKIVQIDIQTSNKKHKAEIATLVDKIDFLQATALIRKKWTKTEVFNPLPLDEFLHKYVMTANDTIDNLEERNIRLSEFNDDVYKVLKKFKRGKNFKKVVEYVLATGAVPDGIFQSCYFDIVTIGEAEDLNKPERYQYVIVMSPRTEKKEVDKAFKEFQEHLYGYVPTNDFELGSMGKINFHNSTNGFDIQVPGHMELIEQYHKGNIFSSAADDIGKRLDLDRTRIWYWMRFNDYFNGITESPNTYEDVAEEWRSKCPLYPTDDDEMHDKNCEFCHVNASNIAHALSNYEKLLEQ